MTAEAIVKIFVECDGLGNGIINIPCRFTDTNTPDDYRRIDTMISTTAILLSAIVNIPSAEVCGLALVARDGDVYINTISTTVSTAGGFIPDSQGNFFSYKPGNSCKITVLGSDADTAITGIIYSAVT